MTMATFNLRASRLNYNNVRPKLWYPTSTTQWNKVQRNSSTLKYRRRKTRIPRLSGQLDCLWSPSQHSLFLSIPSRKPHLPQSGYPALLRRTKTPIWQKTTIIPRNLRSGTSANLPTRIGLQSNIYHSHEEQDQWPIHSHPLHVHPVSDWYVGGDLSKPTDWPGTEY